MLLSSFALVAIGLASFTSAAPVASTAATAKPAATTAGRMPTLDDLATSAKTADEDTLTRLELALELGNAPAHSVPRVQRRSNADLSPLCGIWQRAGFCKNVGMRTTYRGSPPHCPSACAGPFLKDGTLCGTGNECSYYGGSYCGHKSCNLCENGHRFWESTGMSTCGIERKWKAGHRCQAPSQGIEWTSCQTTCEAGLGYSLWTRAGGHRCGREPCWSAGTVCGAGTTCNACCSGAEAPWYWFGIGKCR